MKYTDTLLSLIKVEWRDVRYSTPGMSEDK